MPVEFEAQHTQGEDFVYNFFMLDMDKDDEVMLRGTNPNGFNDNATTFIAVNEDDDVLQMTVTGDIQTLVDKDLNNLEIPNISTLFYANDGISLSLSSDSNLTCTGNKLTYSCFAEMFKGQEFLETPMNLPNITNDSFADLSGVLEDDALAPFMGMYYNCTSLTKMFDIPNISAHISNNISTSIILQSFKDCLLDTLFAISDDGETLNFQHNLTWDDTNLLYDYFLFVGNTNGLGVPK